MRTSWQPAGLALSSALATGAVCSPHRGYLGGEVGRAGGVMSK